MFLKELHEKILCLISISTQVFSIKIEIFVQICQNFGIDAPIHISVKEGDLNSMFNRIVTAAEHPHLSVPETEVGRSQKRYRHLVNRSLMFTSGTMNLIPLNVSPKKSRKRN